MRLNLFVDDGTANTFVTAATVVRIPSSTCGVLELVCSNVTPARTKTGTSTPPRAAVPIAHDGLNSIFPSFSGSSGALVVVG